MLQGWDMTNATRESTPALRFVGVDMAQPAFQWALHDVRETQSASNDEPGFEALLEALHGRSVGLIAIEATGGLERRLAGFLLNHGLPVTVVNPRAARDFARSMGHLAGDPWNEKRHAVTP
jgi:transposase